MKNGLRFSEKTNLKRCGSRNGDHKPNNEHLSRNKINITTFILKCYCIDGSF